MLHSLIDLLFCIKYNYIVEQLIDK